jgi:hypothetical protein
MSTATLASGAVPASLVTTGTFGAGSYTFPSTVNATTFVGALTGNASTATTLQTTRQLWGRDFNGSASVGGRILVVIGESPVMTACTITRVSDDAWDTIKLFETSIKALRNAEKPSAFRF